MTVPSRQGFSLRTEAADGLVGLVMPLNPFPRRGAALLLNHAAALTGDRERAYVRLEREVGERLARLLVGALAPQGRRGSSSP